MHTDQTSETSFVDPRDMSSTNVPLSPPTSNSDEGSSTLDSSSKPATSTPNKKKRKSWGQVLPKPTTNLPPRKRAKTEDEKAQRLYERVQRNRAAAHNSRMRKQNEMEDVQAENNRLKQDLQASQDEIERLKEELSHVRRQSSTQFEMSPNFTHSPLSRTDDLSPGPPSLTSGPTDDDSTLDSDHLDIEPTTSFTPDLASSMKPSDDSHSAVDVGIAKYYEGSGLGFSNDMMNYFDFDVQIPQAVLPTQQTPTDLDLDLDLDHFINLDGLVDSKDSTMLSQDTWQPTYLTGFEPQIQSDFMSSVPSTPGHLPTLAGQSLF